jgi:hypothetical protein
MEARPTRIGALSKREYDHDPKTMHWQGAGRTATVGRWQLYLAEFTHEEIAEKVGMHRSVVSRDLQSARDVCRSGDSPDLEVARFTQMAIRTRGQAPYTLYEAEARYTTSGSQYPFRTAIASRGGGRILERKEDLLPAGRWIRPPTEVVIRYAK